MLRDWHLPKVGDLLCFGLWWQGKVRWDHLLALFLWLPHGLLHDYLVHGSMEVKFYLEEDVGGLNVLFLFELTRCSGHFHNSGFLLCIEVSKLLHWHKVNEEVVAYLRIGIDSFAVSLGNSLSEDSGIFRVKKKIYPAELHVLSLFDLLGVPVPRVFLGLFVVLVDKNWAPGTNTIIHVESLAWNRLERAIWLLSVGYPLGW